MVLLTKSVATVLLVAIVSASVGAAACLFDCESQAAPAAVSTGSCHEDDSLDAGGVAITQTAVICHRDHDGLAAELGSRNDAASFRAAEVAHVEDAWTSSARPIIFGSFCLPVAHPAVQAPVGALLPLRL